MLLKSGNVELPPWCVMLVQNIMELGWGSEFEVMGNEFHSYLAWLKWCGGGWSWVGVVGLKERTE